jgi:hypothetical protein
MEGAVADQNQRPATGGSSDADAAGNAETHPSIVTGCGKRGVFDLHGGEQAVADVGRHRHGPVAIEQIIDRGRDIGWIDGLVVGRKAAPIIDHRPIETWTSASHSTGAGRERVDKIADRQIGIDMVADAHFAVEGEHRPSRIEPALRQCEIHIGEDHPEKQQRVGILDHASYGGFAGGAEI